MNNLTEPDRLFAFMAASLKAFDTALIADAEEARKLYAQYLDDEFLVIDEEYADDPLDAEHARFLARERAELAMMYAFGIPPEPKEPRPRHISDIAADVLADAVLRRNGLLPELSGGSSCQ